MDAPLVNDFFAMISTAAAPPGRPLVRRIGGHAAERSHQRRGRMVSAEPAVRTRLARLASPHPDLRDRLTRGTTGEIRAALAGLGLRACGTFREFGDRTVNELKLESATLHDDPLPLFRAVGSLAQQYAAAGGAERAAMGDSPADRLRRESKQRVRDALAAHPLRRAVFGWVLRHAQRRVRDRENLRLERTRLFGRVRRIFLEIGRRLHAVEQLDAPRDIFYLEVDEVSRSSTAARRRPICARGGAAEARIHCDADGPPPTIAETRGAVSGNSCRHSATAATRFPATSEAARLQSRDRARTGAHRRRSDDGESGAAGDSSPSTPIPAGSWSFPPRAACWSSVAACSRTRPSSRASLASRRWSRCRGSHSG
jgi:pyruvate,water dikinase